ncbi:MAG TPA: DUF4118 domain-containing protein, partial [Verrucomicrobiae bacterium]|nr:DUF4118 domain-containing protein [Verrucomicrobiae bacterium]
MVHAFDIIFGDLRVRKAGVGEPARFADGWRSARFSSRLVRFGFAFLLVVAAFALRYRLAPMLGNRLQLAFFITAALGAAWYGGVGPGLFALVAGLLLGDYFFMVPPRSFLLRSPVEMIVMVSYFCTTGIGVVMIENLHRSRRQARQLQRENAEHARVEESLRHSEQRFRELADAMPQMVWTSREGGRLEYANRKWFEYSGLSEEQTYRPVGWMTVVHRADRGRV